MTPQPTVDHLGSQFEVPAPPRRTGRLRVESAYVKRLRDGEGTGNLAVELGMMGEKGEMDEDDVEVFAMVTSAVEIEGTDPETVEEARARCGLLSRNLKA